MFIQKIKIIITIVCLLSTLSPLSANDINTLLKALKKQQIQIDKLTKKVQKQDAVHNEVLTHYIKNEVDKALKNQTGNLLTLSNNIEHLTIKADLRVRWENINWKGNSEPDANAQAGKQQDRFRQRFRLGFIWQTNEDWEIAAGLATGDSSANSTNDTYSDSSAFETGDIRLDYAYAKHHFSNGLSLTLGQHQNPFVMSSVYYDSDIRTVGVTTQYKNDLFFATLGGFEVYNYDMDEEDSAKMVAAQLGLKSQGFLLAGSYFHYNSATSEIVGSSASDFNILHTYAEYSGNTGKVSYKLHGEYFINMGADNDGSSQFADQPENHNQGFVLGVNFDIDFLSFGYQYVEFEADSTVASLVEGDFGGTIGSGTNMKAHRFILGYKVTKSFSIDSTYMMIEEIVGTDESELFQLDFNYKF
ncbi:MAG: putative porin [Lentisphaeraceae bacterium]|nr:putative porin [Lentisphaeraceae bacterium]